MAGLPAGDLPGRRLESLLGDGKASGLLRGFTDGRHGAARSVALETRLRRAGGALVPVELSAAATEWQGTAAVVVVARDVSERKQAEELLRIQQLKLMRSDKLASLGELVAGVAHEVNNPNQVVSMGARFLEEATPRLLALAESSAELDEELRLAGRPYREFKRAYIQAITDIEASSNRIDHIVRELKGYVRGGESHHLPLDLNEVALSVVDLTRSIVEKAGASLQLELCDSRLEVVGDFVELEQVVLNLIENACQALPDGGGAIMLSTWSMEGRACLCVRDTGSGVSADDLAHLTEPFFTTRAECGGSGLGLSIVNRIVQGHGGELEIESQPGRGTSVTVRIPCAGKSGGL